MDKVHDYASKNTGCRGMAWQGGTEKVQVNI